VWRNPGARGGGDDHAGSKIQRGVMTVQVGINGFGRIGCCAFRSAIERGDEDSSPSVVVRV
jgi:hypothetical protein